MSNSFKIPKVKEDDLHEIEIYRSGVVDTGKATKIRCRKQIIEGVTIPRGFEIWAPECLIKNEFSTHPKAYIRGWKLNQVLKFLVMEGLRNG